MTQSAAYEHNGRSCTDAHFYDIACDPRRHVVVEACAGAGKTWVLVSRILRALLDGTQPQDILAITFTRKAAGEMNQRLLEWLQDFARPRPPTADKLAETPEQWHQRLEVELQLRGLDAAQAAQLRDRLRGLHAELLRHGRPVQIRTFHSWFITLLRGAPLALLQELGLPGQYELIENDKDVVAEAWRPFLQALAGDDGLRADYNALVATLGRTRTHEALEAALDKRTEFALADGVGHVESAVAPASRSFPEFSGFNAPAQALQGEAARTRWLERARALGQEKPKTPQKAAEAVVDALARAKVDADANALLAALRQAFFVAKEDRLNTHLTKFAPAQEAEAELQRLLAASAQHEAWLYHQRMARLTRVFVACYARLKRTRGLIDMNDVERTAMHLLSQHELAGWMQQRLDARVRHLLVDEFQDTNPLQWQALQAWLSGYAGAGGGGQDAPRVFIVGDPKQSIYRFRRADPQVFRDAKKFVIEHLGGERLSTDHTRRNAPRLIGGVNQVMAQAQQAGEFEGFRAHTTASQDTGQVLALPLIARPVRQQDGPDEESAAWRDSLSQPRVEPEDSLRAQSCRQVAHWLAGRIHAGVQPQELMVLARKRAALSVLQAELRALGVPSEQPEEQRLGALPAVQDVLALVDALVSPGHDLSLARVLKSPLFGLDDAALVRLAQLALAARASDAGAGVEPVPGSWLALLPQAGLADVHAQLMRWRHSLLSLPPHDALQAIYTEGDVLARFAVAAPPAECLAVQTQLRAVLSAALQIDGGRYLTAYAWLRALRRQRVSAPRPAVSQAVQLLTVHGAKGLEAQEVVLLDAAVASGARRGGPGVLIDWPGDQSAPCRLAFVARDNAPPPDLIHLAAQEEQAQAREELNALYVAMTRAKTRLVLAGFEPHQRPADSWWLRLQDLSEVLPVPEPVSPRTAPSVVGAASRQVLLTELPRLDLPAPAPVLVAESELADDSLDARVGQAMHHLLEHAGDGSGTWSAQRLRLVQRQFGLDATGLARAELLARKILRGAGRWAWQADEVVQAFDEIELVHEGQRLRIDRLVQRRAMGGAADTWWVLDYKSAASPDHQSELQQQLVRYRMAVQALHPGQSVRAAFLSGDGRMLEVT